jgi:hypothetical protein
MNEAQSDEDVRFRRRMRNAIIGFAIVEFIVTAYVVGYMMQSGNL